MALMIIDKCVNRDACEPECSNGTISMGPEAYVISPGEYTEYVGYFDEPQCQQACSVDCIPKGPAHEKTHDQLMQKYTQFTPTPPCAA